MFSSALHFCCTEREAEPIFLRGLHTAERRVAERLRALPTARRPGREIDVEKAAPWVEKRTGKTLAPSQRAAIEMALRSKVAVITGGPGVGKTTLLDTVLRILLAKVTKILLAAPPNAWPNRPG